MAKVINKPNNSVPVCEMKDGQVAVLVSGCENSMIGVVVQRHRTDLIIIGDTDRYTGMFIDNDAKQSSIVVEILQPGTQIEL